MLRQTAIAAALALTAGAAAAQCPIPDNLNGPCWQQLQANLPQFPDITMESAGVCWSQCTPQPIVCTTLSLPAPNQISCGRYSTQLKVNDCVTGGDILNGTVVLDYTRTWQEMGPNNQQLQESYM